MPVTQPHAARQVGRTLWFETVEARRKRIADLARCRGCGATQGACEAGRNGQKGPEGLCCWGGIPGHGHVEDARLVSELLAEVAAGEVRTVTEVYPPSVQGPALPSYDWLLSQDVWWYPRRRPAIRIAEMEKTHRYNTANWLERKAASLHLAVGGRWYMADAPDEVWAAWEREDPVEWLNSQPLMKALRKGLPTRGRKLEALAERAGHWHTCPLALRPEKRSYVNLPCTCVTEDGRTIGATNDPNPVPVRPVVPVRDIDGAGEEWRIRDSSSETYPG